MRIVWGRGTATVRDVYEALPARRRISCTTVMTMMKIMEGKRCLKGHQLLYQAAVEAVKQWVCQPTSLNSTPVPVFTTVNLPFRRKTI